MPSRLGTELRKARTARGVGLRELARLIGKSPAFLTQLERDAEPPPATEETLRAIAEALDLDPDRVLVLAKRTPQDVAPSSALDVALYRRVKKLSDENKRNLLRELDEK